jgi:CCR4-NOT transcriptional complex subunit CAF120
MDTLDGRPYTDRKWVECFAQLIGTVLWMWDADSLDQGGPEAESKPTHMNVADATVKMVSPE